MFRSSLMRRAENALNARTVRDMPKPEDWLRALGVKPIVPIIFQGPPRVVCGRRNSSNPVSANLNNRLVGDFSFAHASLNDITYTREPTSIADKPGERLRLAFAGNLPALVRRAGKSDPIKDSERAKFEVYAGDTICMSDWEIAFEDSKAN